MRKRTDCFFDYSRKAKRIWVNYLTLLPVVCQDDMVLQLGTSTNWTTNPKATSLSAIDLYREAKFNVIDIDRKDCKRR